MSVWDDLGPTVANQVTDETSDFLVTWTADWIRKGMSNKNFTQALVEKAIQAGHIDRSSAAKWARKHLGWRDAWEIYHQRRYRQPDNDVVRTDWRRIPSNYLTAAEKAMRDDSIERLKSKHPGAVAMLLAGRG